MVQPVTSRVTLTYCWMPKPRDDAAPILLDSALIEVEIAVRRFWAIIQLCAVTTKDDTVPIISQPRLGEVTAWRW